MPAGDGAQIVIATGVVRVKEFATCALHPERFLDAAPEELGGVGRQTFGAVSRGVPGDILNLAFFVLFAPFVNRFDGP